MDQSICASLNLFQGTEEQMHFHEMGKEHSIYWSQIWKTIHWLHNFRFFYSVPLVVGQCYCHGLIQEVSGATQCFKSKHSPTHSVIRLFQPWIQFFVLVDKLTFLLFADCFADEFVQLYLMPEIKFTVGCNYQLQWGKISFKGQTMWLQLLPTPPLSEMHNAALDSYLNITQQQAHNPQSQSKTSFKLRPTHLITGVESRATVVDKIITLFGKCKL